MSSAGAGKAADAHAEWPLWLRWTVVFVATFVTGVAGFALPKFGARDTLALLPSGIAVAACYRWGWRTWPAVAAAGFAMELWESGNFFGAAGVALGLAGSGVITATLLRRWQFNPNFSRASDVPWFVIAAAAGMIWFPSIGFLGAWIGGWPKEEFRVASWVHWWGNTTSGVLLLSPILVCVSRRSLARFLRHRLASLVWSAGVALCCVMIFVAPGDVGRPLIVVAANLLIIVAAIRFGVVVAGTGALLITAGTAASVVFSVGAFAAQAKVQGLVTVWSFSAALVGINLVITALLAERDAEALERQRAEGRYAQVFDGSPQPLWVSDRQTGAFLLVNAATEQQYGWSRDELLAGTVSLLAAPGDRPVLPASVELTAVEQEPAEEPLETLHATKSGRVLDVDVWSRPIEFGGRPAALVFAVDVTERRALAGALVDAIGGEQRRIGQEMHDGLGQELTGLALSARALANRAERERLDIVGELNEIAGLANHCIQGARNIVRGLAPLTDSEGSLEAGLAELARRSSLGEVAVEFRGDLTAPVDIDLPGRSHLYRIAQEAVQNALKHAGARSIEVELAVSARRIRLSVRDNGRGPPVDGGRGAGLGMRTMRFRARAIGGKLAVSRGPDGGTVVVCELPNLRVLAAAG
jgi:PAS domain S-box-containing protein